MLNNHVVIEKNNLHDLDTWIFFKWIFKTFVAVLLVTNTWNIVMGVFDVTQSVVNQSAGVIISDTSIDVTTVITDIEAKLDAMSVGGLLGLWFQCEAARRRLKRPAGAAKPR